MFYQQRIVFRAPLATWNDGGVAFIKNSFSPAVLTWARMYLISEEQFMEVVQQEIKTNGVKVDFEKTKKEGSSIIKEKSWYGRIIYLGEQDNYPMFTFTSENDSTNINAPDEHYLKTLVSGIRQSHGFDDKTILEYLITKEGIKGK